MPDTFFEKKIFRCNISGFFILMVRNKKRTLMIYIIHNRIIWIVYNEHDLNEQFRRQFFPSWRKEHREPVTVMRL